MGVIEKLLVGVSPLPLDYVLAVQIIKGEERGGPKVAVDWKRGIRWGRY